MTSLLLNERTWIWIGSLLYLTGFAADCFLQLQRRRHSRPLVYGFLSAGFIFQTVGLYIRGQEIGGCPIGNKFELVQFITWSAILLYLVIGPAFRLSLLGYFTSAMVAVLSLTSLLRPSWDLARQNHLIGANPWIEFHAALALFSYAVFGLLAVTSLMYLLQNYSLKNKRVRGIFAYLPSILDLELINLRLLGMGVAILSVSLTLGSVHWLGDPESVNTPKLLITVSIWAAYLIALALRLRSILISSRLAWVCVLLFGLALLSIDPVNASRQAPDSNQSVAMPGF